MYSTARNFDRQLHETLGLCVFTLAVMRVLWRMVDTRPAPPQVPRWMGVMALAVKGALYVLLFAVPLTAMAGAWLEGHSLTLLTGVEIPPLVRKSHHAGATIANIHTWLGDTILWLAGFHASPVSIITLSSGTTCLPLCFHAGCPCDSRTEIEKRGSSESLTSARPYRGETPSAIRRSLSFDQRRFICFPLTAMASPYPR